MRLAQRATSWPGHGKPRAGLPRRGLDRRASGERRKGAVPPRLTLCAVSPAPTFTVRRCARGYEHRPRPASSRPRPGRRSGVNRKRFNITAPSANLPQSLRCAPLGGSSAARPAGSQKGRLCLAPLRVGRCAGFARAAQQPVGALALSRQREGLARRCAQGGERPPPAPRGLLRRASALRASRPVLAAPAPVRPRKRGLPEVQRPPRHRGEKAPTVCPGSIAPCSPRQGFGLRPARAARP